LAREMTCSVADLACFGHEEGNGTEKEDVGMVGWAEWKSSGRRIAGQGAWTSATRPATVMPICSAAGKRSCRAAILWRNRDARLGGDSEKRLGEIR
jgi:hypothetical protein